MVTWHINGLDLDRIMKETQLILPSCSAFCCNFEIGIYAAPSVGDLVYFEDGRKIRLTRICPKIHTEDEILEMHKISHYECGYTEAGDDSD